MEKPFAPACQRNQEPILEVLRQIFKDNPIHVLEIGSGTGQHAAYFSEHLPHLHWTTSDDESYHNGIKLWIQDLTNVAGPLNYQAGRDEFPPGNYQAVFSANTLHIMSWKNAKTLFKHLGRNLKSGAKVLFYGPFNYHQKYTSPTNKEFDLKLKEHNIKSAIRNFEDVVINMSKAGFHLQEDFKMPANNHLLYFAKDKPSI